VVTDLGVLPVGRHRVAFVVKGDGSRTDARIDVLAPTARLVVTDVDGTQTTAEYEEVGSVLGGTLPGARPGGAAYLRALADKGYVPFYLTARPEFLTGRTREFLASRGYPPGPVHTTTSLTGALHAAAAAYKTAELAALRRRGLSIAFLLGNRPSDAVAFTTEAEAAERCLLLEVNDPVHGCRTVGAWTELIKEVDDLPSTCP
jgi:phosphatidate phosphatase PAH1